MPWAGRPSTHRSRQPSDGTARPHPRRPWRWRWAALAAALAALCALPAPQIYTSAATRPYRHANMDEVPACRVALVFGARVIGGWPSPMLSQRVRGAVALYQAGKVEKLLFSGDGSHRDYDEVNAMRAYAIQLGIPAEDITLDYAGFSTYETCYRAREIFGLGEAILVTQHYHLPRAVYTCRRLGIAAAGFGLPDWTRDPERSTVHYSRSDKVHHTLRELLATYNALWQVHVTRPLPTFLGPFEGIR